MELIDTEYVHEASLAQLIGDSRAVDVVCQPSGCKRADLLKALAVVESALCPWPALRIQTWFWDTQAGQIVRAAQWVAYGDEALWPGATCRLLWGATGTTEWSRLHKAVRSGALRAYRPPAERRIVRGRKIGVYFRHSQVLMYYRSQKETKHES